MNALQDVDGLSECIGKAIQEHLARFNINIAWPQLDNLDHPILRVEAFLEEADATHAARAQSEKIASVSYVPNTLQLPMCSSVCSRVHREPSIWRA